MSVIGLTWLLTHRLMRWRSFQASAESTTSRGIDDFVLHSGSYSTQNSTQPIGGRVASPTAANSGRSSAEPPRGDANSASTIMPAAAPRLRIAFATGFIVTPSRLVGVTFRTKLLRRR